MALFTASCNSIRRTSTASAKGFDLIFLIFSLVIFTKSLRKSITGCRYANIRFCEVLCIRAS